MLRLVPSRATSTSPSSHFATPPLPDDDDPAEVERVLRIELEAYNALVDEGGRPSHPIGPNFDILDEPGDYKEIITYWQGHTSRLLFTCQLEHWRKFRRCQQVTRQYHLQRGALSVYEEDIRELRQKFGLAGNFETHQQLDRQSELTDWMEYQYYELWNFEKSRKKLEAIQEKLNVEQTRLREAGLPEVEEVCDLGPCAVGIKITEEKREAFQKRLLAEKELKFAQERLKAASSLGQDGRIHESVWIGSVQQEVDALQMRLDSLKKSGVNRRSDWASWSDFCDELWKMQFAERKLKAAKLDEIGESIDQAALIKMTQMEVDSAQTQLDRSRKVEEDAGLRSRVRSGLYGVAFTKEKMREHEVLLGWIEEQRQLIASNDAAFGREVERYGHQGPVSQESSGAPRRTRSDKAKIKIFLAQAASTASMKTSKDVPSKRKRQPSNEGGISQDERDRASAKRRLISFGGSIRCPLQGTNLRRPGSQLLGSIYLQDSTGGLRRRSARVQQKYLTRHEKRPHDGGPRIQ